VFGESARSSAALAAQPAASAAQPASQPPPVPSTVPQLPRPPKPPKRPGAAPSKMTVAQLKASAGLPTGGCRSSSSSVKPSVLRWSKVHLRLSAELRWSKVHLRLSAWWETPESLHRYQIWAKFGQCGFPGCCLEEKHRGLHMTDEEADAQAYSAPICMPSSSTAPPEEAQRRAQMMAVQEVEAQQQAEATQQTQVTLAAEAAPRSVHQQGAKRGGKRQAQTKSAQVAAEQYMQQEEAEREARMDLAREAAESYGSAVEEAGERESTYEEHDAVLEAEGGAEHAAGGSLDAAATPNGLAEQDDEEDEEDEESAPPSDDMDHDEGEDSSAAVPGQALGAALVASLAMSSAKDPFASSEDEGEDEDGLV